ncbi:MAG: zinc/manganese transport system substrate-binding protein [Nocardioidaceae bacterium]|nr:zinc/manganese transport system substrate-binding protein [Nocardioidaceae bacterium]
MPLLRRPRQPGHPRRPGSTRWMPGRLTATARRTAASAVLVAGLAGCAGGAPGSGAPGRIDVVASTSVWGDIAAQVGAPWVDVTSIISDPAQDPHSYQASTRTLLAIKDADLLVENGGGYDDFMQQMISASATTAPVLDAVAISGLRPPVGGDLNEHVWYNLPTAEKVANRLAAALGRLAPRHAAAFTVNADAFDHQVEGLIRAEHRVRASDAGVGVGITEPVPLYMLQAMGLHNLTPPEFSRAVEESSDVSARVLAQTLALYSQHRVALLVYNEQTSGPITQQVKEAATANAIPVVPVTETLPPGMTYVSWMRQNVTRIKEALSQR